MGDYPGLHRQQKRRYGWLRQAGVLTSVYIIAHLAIVENAKADIGDRIVDDTIASYTSSNDRKLIGIFYVSKYIEFARPRFYGIKIPLANNEREGLSAWTIDSYSISSDTPPNYWTGAARMWRQSVFRERRQLGGERGGKINVFYESGAFPAVADFGLERDGRIWGKMTGAELNCGKREKCSLALDERPALQSSDKCQNCSKYSNPSSETGDWIRLIQHQPASFFRIFGVVLGVISVTAAFKKFYESPLGILFYFLGPLLALSGFFMTSGWLG